VITLLAGVAEMCWPTYAFIFGNWGRAELGVRGAALASFTCTACRWSPW